VSGAAEAVHGAAEEAPAGAGEAVKDPTRGLPDGPLDLQYNKVVMAKKSERTPGMRKAKPSKADLLESAMKRIQEVEAAGGKETEEGQTLEREYAWQTALRRAEGEKVLDDPRLLKKSIKRAEAKKRRSREKWADRLEKQSQQQKTKQDKRKSNLKARADAKISKKIERAEKKRLRPGFEGRKDGFINSKKGTSAA